MLDELLALDDMLCVSVSNATLPSADLFLRNHRRQSDGYVRTTTYLQNRTRCTAQLLADTLALRDQVIAKEQGATMLQLNKSAVFITMLTLIYLPPSLVAVRLLLPNDLYPCRSIADVLTMNPKPSHFLA